MSFPSLLKLPLAAVMEEAYCSLDVIILDELLRKSFPGFFSNFENILAFAHTRTQRLIEKLSKHFYSRFFSFESRAYKSRHINRLGRAITPSN